MELKYKIQKEKEQQEKLKHLTELDKMERAKKEKPKDSIATKGIFGAKPTSFKAIRGPRDNAKNNFGAMIFCGLGRGG